MLEKISSKVKLVDQSGRQLLCEQASQPGETSWCESEPGGPVSDAVKQYGLPVNHWTLWSLSCSRLQLLREQRSRGKEGGRRGGAEAKEEGEVRMRDVRFGKADIKLCVLEVVGGEREYRETLRGQRVCSHSSFIQSDSRGNITLRPSLCVILRGDAGTRKVNNTGIWEGHG